MILMLSRRDGARLGIVTLMLLALACGSGESRASGSSEAPGQAGSTFNVNVSRPQGGTIASVVGGVADGKVNCGTKGGTANGCAEVTYPWSQGVTFTATPDPGFKFTGWAADCIGTGPCSVDTTQRGADKWIAAVFEPVVWYPGVYFLVTVTRPSGGTVASDDGRIRCGTATNANVCGPALYLWSDSVTLSAVADEGNAFDGWTGDCSGATCTLSTTPNGTDKAVTATFGSRPPRECTVTNGTGTQTWDGADYGPCTATSCNIGYSLAGGACNLTCEMLSVPTDGSSVQSGFSYPVGTPITITVSGTVIWGGCDPITCPYAGSCGYKRYGDAVYVSDTCFAGSYTYSVFNNGLQLRINDQPPPAGVFNPGHVYLFHMLGNNQPLRFSYYDYPGYYGDNSGSLTVNVCVD